MSSKQEGEFIRNLLIKAKKKPWELKASEIIPVSILESIRKDNKISDRILKEIEKGELLWVGILRETSAGVLHAPLPPRQICCR